MTIDGTQSIYANLLVASSTQNSGDTADFAASLAAAEESKPTKTKRELEAEKTAEEIKAFFAKMDKYGNALSYVVNSNLEKIEELIEKKKEELKKAAGFDSEPPLSPEAKAEAMKEIEKTLAEYAEELLKELEDKAKSEKAVQRKGASLKELLAV